MIIGFAVLIQLVIAPWPGAIRAHAQIDAFAKLKVLLKVII
ncbi:MAG: hypothetical protein AAGL23_01475 [Pseudomonadota bacterium]